MELPAQTYIFELLLQNIINSASRSNRLFSKFKLFNSLPALERDLALIVNKNVPSAEIVNTIKQNGNPLLESVALIDRFEGSKLGPGKCSQAFRLKYRGNKTLSDSDVNPIHEKVRSALESKFSAELRS